MTAVFVHGVPETTVVWEPLVRELDRGDVELLSLPGFGRPLPVGFVPTKESYAAWLASELEAFDEVDLVAHDWGGLLALRVLADHPVNVRSWLVDANDLSPDFRWHDMALLWQTRGDGEAFMEGFQASSAEEREALLVASGVPESGAKAMAASIDATMGEAILVLYRSGIDVGVEWGPCVDDIAGPGSVIEAALDPFRQPGAVRRLAARTGAEVLELPEGGHWWMLESPGAMAASIASFWARV